MDIYCAVCNGTVNKGSACPFEEKPNACPLTKTIAEHNAALKAESKKPKPAAPAAPVAPVA